jgi:hypothetical protein
MATLAAAPSKDPGGFRIGQEEVRERFALHSHTERVSLYWVLRENDGVATTIKYTVSKKGLTIVLVLCYSHYHWENGS